MLLKSQVRQLPRIISLCQSRNTWVFQHVVAPPKTKSGSHQRRPEELQDFMKYSVVREPTDLEDHTVKVILLEDVEGVGHQFDIMEFDHNFARDTLLLPKKAVYASPFDLVYYAQMKEKMKEQLAARVRIPYDYVKLGRELLKKLIPVHVSIDNQWQIDSFVLHASLFEEGIIAPSDTIFLPEKYAYSGPNFDLEAALLRFYVVVNKQYVVPMTGRLAHISGNDLKESAYPFEITTPNDEQLQKYGIKNEQPYYHRTADLDSTSDIVELMSERTV